MKRRRHRPLDLVDYVQKIKELSMMVFVSLCREKQRIRIWQESRRFGNSKGRGKTLASVASSHANETKKFKKN